MGRHNGGFHRFFCLAAVILPVVKAAYHAGMRPAVQRAVTCDAVRLAGGCAVRNLKRVHARYNTHMVVVKQITRKVASALPVAIVQIVAWIPITPGLKQQHAWLQIVLHGIHAQQIVHLSARKVVAAVHGVLSVTKRIHGAHHKPNAVTGTIHACSSGAVGWVGFGNLQNAVYKFFAFHPLTALLLACRALRGRVLLRAFRC